MSPLLRYLSNETIQARSQDVNIFVHATRYPRVHVWYIYLHLVNVNVGIYTIHGSYGTLNPNIDPNPWTSLHVRLAFAPPIRSGAFKDMAKHFEPVVVK